MRKKLITDVELRAHWSYHPGDPICLEENVILTPSARDFLREHHIPVTTVKGYGTMTRQPVPFRDGAAVYIDAASGQELHAKPEEMTHLRGNLLVPKTHPQIFLRGKLDSLTAQILCVEVLAEEERQTEILRDLEELLTYTQAILAAEVKDEPLPEQKLLGMDQAEIRHASHCVKETLGIDHPIPDYRMGRLCMELNRLRTQVREAELAAAQAFSDTQGRCSRPDLLQGLNRLSSCVYLIFCRKLAGYYDGRRKP